VPTTNKFKEVFPINTDYGGGAREQTVRDNTLDLFDQPIKAFRYLIGILR